MYPDLQKELDTFVRRTPKSAEAHKKNLKRIPLGVASNYRVYDPHPIFVKEGQGSKIRDIDGNEYVDHNLCFGALMADRSTRFFDRSEKRTAAEWRAMIQGERSSPQEPSASRRRPKARPPDTSDPAVTTLDAREPSPVATQRTRPCGSLRRAL